MCELREECVSRCQHVKFVKNTTFFFQGLGLSVQQMPERREMVMLYLEMHNCCCIILFLCALQKYVVF